MTLSHQKLSMAVAKPLLAANYNNQNFTLGRMKLQLKSPSVYSGQNLLFSSTFSQRHFSSGSPVVEQSAAASIFDSADFMNSDTETISE